MMPIRLKNVRLLKVSHNERTNRFIKQGFPWLGNIPPESLLKLLESKEL